MDDPSLSRQTTIVATEGILSTELEEETVLLDRETGTYYGFNEVATQVWHCVQEPRTVDEVIEILVTEYDVDPDRLEADLDGFLQELRDAELIEIEHDTHD